MPKKERKWHPKFLEYMDMIIHHPNYRGLRIDKKLTEHMHGLQLPSLK